MFFMRVSQNFSSLVKLIKEVLLQVGPFTIFFVIWMGLMSLIFKVTGITLTEGSSDYPNVENNFAEFIQNFRNSIGDITTPQHSFWFPAAIDGLKGPVKTYASGQVSGLSMSMAYWGWALFLFHEFFILICLLNFLIAIISQAYDEVMSSQEIDMYRSRCDLNQEVCVLVDYFYPRVAPKHILYVMANNDHDDAANEFGGMVRGIKQATQKQINALRDDIKSLFVEAEREANKKNADVKKEVSDIKKEVSDVRSQNDRILESIEALKKSLPRNE